MITDWSTPIGALFDAAVLFALLAAVWAIHWIRRL